MLTRVAKSIVVSSVPPAALARPAVSPEMLSVPSDGLLKWFTAPTSIESAVTVPSICDVTAELTLLAATAPAPDRKPLALATTCVLTVDTCEADMPNAPVPPWVRSTTAPLPTVADVMALVLVVGAAAAPASTPPEPAVVAAKTLSLPMALTCTLPACTRAELPIVALVVLLTEAVAGPPPTATSPTEELDELALCFE